jgi:hypothetical protein
LCAGSALATKTLVGDELANASSIRSRQCLTRGPFSRNSDGRMHWAPAPLSSMVHDLRNVPTIQTCSMFAETILSAAIVAGLCLESASTPLRCSSGGYCLTRKRNTAVDPVDGGVFNNSKIVLVTAAEGSPPRRTGRRGTVGIHSLGETPGSRRTADRPRHRARLVTPPRCLRRG